MTRHLVVPRAWVLETLALVLCFSWSACSDGAGVAPWGESTDGSMIQGTYRRQPVTYRLNPNSGLNVIADPAGNCISGWRLNPAQLQNVLTHGGI